MLKSPKIFEQSSILRSILNKTSGNMYWKDCEGRLMGCNQNLATFLKLNVPEDIVGKTSFELGKSPEEAKKILEKDLKIVQNKTHSEEEETFTLADGSQRIYITHREPLFDEAGQIIGLLGISTDITDKKMREQLEIQTAALEKAKEMMRFWAASIAHELRTPLQTLDNLGNSASTLIDTLKKQEKLLTDYPDIRIALRGLGSFNRIFPQVIKEAQNYIDMTLTKVSPEKAKPKSLSLLSVKSVVDAFIEKYPFQDYGDGDKELNKVHVNIIDNFNFNGDADLFYHVLANLTKNALYFLKEARKGEIFIEAKAGKSDENFNTLTFKDTGLGMSPELAKNLFQAFMSQSRHGTGVGLYLCKTIMTELGGSIECDSVKGEFARFTMRFPKVT